MKSVYKNVRRKLHSFNLINFTATKASIRSKVIQNTQGIVWRDVTVLRLEIYEALERGS